jgi:hypothetical protein
MMNDDLPDLPIEIINKIFLYVSSPTYVLIQGSPFFKKAFPFMELNRFESPYPFPTNIEIDYHRIYSKMRENKYDDVDEIEYRRFHEFSNMEKCLEDIDHDQNMECESESDIIERHYLYFIFHHRYWYNEYNRIITDTYDKYTENPSKFERHPWLFKKVLESKMKGECIIIDEYHSLE